MSKIGGGRVGRPPVPATPTIALFFWADDFDEDRPAEWWFCGDAEGPELSQGIGNNGPYPSVGAALDAAVKWASDRGFYLSVNAMVIQGTRPPKHLQQGATQ